MRGEFFGQTRFHQGNSPNPGAFELPVWLPGQLAPVVVRARQFMAQRRKDFLACLEPQLASERNSLRRLREGHVRQLELDFPDAPNLFGARLGRKEKRQRDIDRIFANYQSWVEDTLTIENIPFLRVAAVFIG